jgi:hypothetical protein
LPRLELFVVGPDRRRPRCGGDGRHPAGLYPATETRPAVISEL